MNNTHPRQGTEFDWIATDVDGKIALMSSAGYGNCPSNETQWMDNQKQLFGTDFSTEPASFC